MHGFSQGSPKSHFLECILMGSRRSPQPAGCCWRGVLNSSAQANPEGGAVRYRQRFLFTSQRQRKSDLPVLSGTVSLRAADSEGARGGRVRGGSGSRPELSGSMTNTSSFDKEKTVGDRQGDARSSTSNRTGLPSATPDLALSLCLSLCLLLMEMTRSLTGDCLIPCPPQPPTCAPITRLRPSFMWSFGSIPSAQTLSGSLLQHRCSICDQSAAQMMIFMRLRQDSVKPGAGPNPLGSFPGVVDGSCGPWKCVGSPETVEGPPAEA